MENLLKAIKLNDITKVKDCFVTDSDALRDESLYCFVKFVRDVEMFSTIFNMYGEDIMDCYEKRNESIISHAILYDKDLKIIETILYFYKDSINGIDFRGDTPLLYAVSINRDMSLIKFLLENNADVNVCNPYGKAPLHFAKTLEVVKLLIENGAMINVTDKDGYTPLMKAINCERDKEIILEFLKNGADVEITNHLGQSCLHLAMNFKYDEDVINEICCKTLNYNLEDYRGLTPLFYALDNLNFGPPYQIDFILRLIKKGFVVNSNVIMHAVRHCQSVDLIRSLIKYVDIRCVDKYKNCVLHFACDVQVINVLVQRGAPVNHENEERKTPLTNAIFQQMDTKIIERLLFWGSDVKNLFLFFDDNFIFSDSVYDLLILYGMSVSLKNIFIECFFSHVLHSIARYMPTRLNCSLLRHIFLSNKNVMIPENLRTNDKVKDLFKSYNYEINKMKDEKFTNHVSYYSFCTKQYRSIKSQFVHKGFTKDDYKNIIEQFPMFCNEIAIKIKINIKIHKRKELLKNLIHVNLGKLIEKDYHSNNDEDDICEYVGLDYDSMYAVSYYLKEREISCLLAAAII